MPGRPGAPPRGTLPARHFPAAAPAPRARGGRGEEAQPAVAGGHAVQSLEGAGQACFRVFSTNLRGVWEHAPHCSPSLWVRSTPTVSSTGQGPPCSGGLSHPHPGAASRSVRRGHGPASPSMATLGLLPWWGGHPCHGHLPGHCSHPLTAPQAGIHPHTPPQELSWVTPPLGVQGSHPTPIGPASKPSDFGGQEESHGCSPQYHGSRACTAGRGGGWVAGQRMPTGSGRSSGLSPLGMQKELGGLRGCAALLLPVSHTAMRAQRLELQTGWAGPTRAQTRRLRDGQDLATSGQQVLHPSSSLRAGQKGPQTLQHRGRGGGQNSV